VSENTDIHESGEGPSEHSVSTQREREKRAGYLAFAAHEVRNPLSTALWSAELLARMPAAERGGARGEKLAAMCLRALTRLRLLVEDHFLIERLETGGLPMRVEAVVLPDVLAAAIARRPPESGPCDVGALPDVLVSADRPLLERSLDALLYAAGQRGARVRVSGSRDDGRVSVYIQGASPAESGLVDPGRGSESDGKGYSLSLPMAKRAARALGGELEVAQGGFLLTLPVHQAPGAPAPE
jgi:signal transduction histidine kinase